MELRRQNQSDNPITDRQVKQRFTSSRDLYSSTNREAIAGDYNYFKTSTSWNTVEGIVHSVVFGQSLIEELLEALKDQGVTEIKPIAIKRNHEIIQTNTYIITFEKQELLRVLKQSSWYNKLVQEYMERPEYVTSANDFHK